MHQQCEHLAFAFRELGLLFGFIDKAVDEHMGLLLAQIAPAARHGVQCLEELGIKRILAEIAIGPLHHNLLDVLLLAVHREDQHLHGEFAGPYLPQALEPAHARHGQIKQHDIHSHLLQLRQDLTSIRGLSNDLEVPLGRKQQLQTRAQYAVIIRE